MDSVASAGGRVVLLPGRYSLGVSVHLGSGVEVNFHNCIVEMASNVPAFVTKPGSSDITLCGALDARGNGHLAHFFRIDHADRVSVLLRAHVSQLGPAMTMVLISESTRVRMTGSFRSEDSAIVRSVDSSSIDISGVQCRFEHNIGESAIRVVSTGTAGTTRDINIHDCDVDGNGQVDIFGALINVSSNTGTPPIESVTIANIFVRGTVKLGDGVDIGRCRGVTVSNVVGDHLNCLVSLMASNAVVSNAVGTDCRAQAVAVGDPTVQTANQENIIVTACMAVNCGTGFGGASGCGLGVLVTPGRTIRRVRFSHCISVGADSTGARYGLSVTAGAFDVRVSDCLLIGTTAPLLIQTAADQVVVVS
jgi:hypothetical protein